MAFSYCQRARSFSRTDLGGMIRRFEYCQACEIGNPRIGFHASGYSCLPEIGNTENITKNGSVIYSGHKSIKAKNLA